MSKFKSGQMVAGDEHGLGFITGEGADIVWVKFGKDRRVNKNMLKWNKDWKLWRVIER